MSSLNPLSASSLSSCSIPLSSYESEITFEYLEQFTKIPKMNPLLILIGGYQGSGKSSLIKEIKQSEVQNVYNFNVISKDEIRFSLFKKGVKFNAEFVKSVDNIFINLLKFALLYDLNVIIDTNMHSQKLREIEDFLIKEKSNHQVYKMALFATEETLKNRVINRKRKNHQPNNYVGTIEELENSLTLHLVNLEEYDLTIDTEFLNKKEVFENFKMFLEDSNGK